MVMVLTSPGFLPVEFQRLLDDAASGGAGANLVTTEQLNAAVATLNATIAALEARVAALEAAAP